MATQRIDRFEILERIGQGGMGTVFKAHDPRINRVVAIKLLREGFDTPDMRERFMREARAAGQLRNPHIVTIFELGEFEEQPYIVMEFVEGEPLDRLIRRGAPLPVVSKLELMETLCSGLAYAHRVGIVHRDIKPPNLLVESEGSVKILDFGIARVEDSELTKVGTLIGTPNYMSPEQLHGGALDKRCDIFAVGAVFYELLSLRRAFPGGGPAVIAHILTREPDPLLATCPDLDPQLDAIVQRALQKAPEARYGDLSEMRRDIVSVRERLERDQSAVGSARDEPQAAGQTPPARREGVFRRALTEVDAARADFERGDVAVAISRLERFEPRNELVDEALTTLRRRAAAQDAVRGAAAASERGDWSAVRDSCNSALALDPDNAAARELRQHALDAIEQRRAAEALDARAAAAIEDAQRLFDAGQHDDALSALASFSPAHAQVTAAHAELLFEAERIAADESARDLAPPTLLHTIAVPATSSGQPVGPAIDPPSEHRLPHTDPPTLVVHTQAATTPDIAAEFPAAEPRRLRPIWLAVAAVAVAALTVAAVVGLRDDTSENREVTSLQTYPVRIDAVPWAEIRISPASSSGGKPIEAITPFFVQLPAGEYRVRFSNPALQRTSEEILTVAADRDNVVRVTLPDADVNAIIDQIMAPKGSQ